MAKLIRIDGKLARLGGKLVLDTNGAPCCCGGGGSGAACCDLHPTCGLALIDGNPDRRMALAGTVTVVGGGIRDGCTAVWDHVYDVTTTQTVSGQPCFLSVRSFQEFTRFQQCYGQIETGQNDTTGELSWYATGQADSWARGTGGTARTTGGTRLISGVKIITTGRLEVGVINKDVVEWIAIAEIGQGGALGWSGRVSAVVTGNQTASISMTAERIMSGSCVSGIRVALGSAWQYNNLGLHSGTATVAYDATVPGVASCGADPPLDPNVARTLDLQARGGGCVGCGP